MSSRNLIHILHHQRDEIIGWIDEVYTDSHHQHLGFDEKEQYDFEVSAFARDVEKIQSRSRFIIPGEDKGIYHEFILWESRDDTEKNIKEFRTYPSYKDMNNLKSIPAQVLEGQTIRSAANYVLEGLIWEIGTVEYSGIRKWVIEKQLDGFDALVALSSLFDCELRFRIEINGNKVTGRYVDFLKRQGEDQGNEIEFHKDLIGIRRTVNNDKLVTALLCIGPEQDNGERLTVTVKDEAAFQNWNWRGQHLIQTYEPQSINEDTTEEELIQLGETELKKRISAAVQYEVSAESLQRWRLGDTARIKDERFNPPMYLESRVISIFRSIFDDSQKDFTLGEVIEHKIEDIFRVWKDLQALYGTKVIKSPYPPRGRSNIIWIQTGGSVEIAHTWNPEINKWVPTGGSLYTWVMYADNQHGAGISSSPVGKSYVGFAYNKTEETPSMNPIEYEWMLLKGDQGVPGLPGEEGQPTYTWIKYADDASGNGISDNPTGKKYVGLSPNQSTETESNDPLHYKWVLVKGEKGDKGDIGPQGPTGLQGIQGPKGDQGIKGATGADGRTSYTHIAYANNSTGTSGFSVSDSNGKSYIGMYTDFSSTDSLNPSIYKWSLIKGADGSQGIQGPPGSNGQTPYFHTAWANNSTGTSEFSTTSALGKTYIGTYTDFTSADSEDPSKYSWVQIKGDKGDTGAPGPTGPTGPGGSQGEPGFKLNWVTSAYGKVDAQGRIYKEGGTSWYEGAYSIESYVGGCFLSFKPAQTNNSIMFGIDSSADTANYYYYNMDHMFYLKNGGTFETRYNGGNSIDHGSYSAGDSFVIIYDGETVKYYHNGNLKRTISKSPDISFSAMFSGSSSKSSYQIYDIFFSPSGSRGPNVVDEHTTFGVDWLEANMIKSLNGLNINNQFKVDGSGNVSFSGHLNGATGSFSGKLNSTQMEVGPLNNESGSPTIFGLQYNNTADGGNTFYTDGIMAFEGWAGGLTIYHRKDGGGADYLTRFNVSARSMDLKGGPFSSDSISSRGNIEASERVVSGSDIYFNNNALIASGSGTNTDHLWHDDGANAWHFVSDSSYKAPGNSKLYAGSLVFPNGVEIDPSSGHARWKAGNGNYIYQNGSSTGDRRGSMYFYFDDIIGVEIYKKFEDYGHMAFVLGETTIQGLNGSTPAAQIRNRANTAYARIDASDFRTVSDERLKENIIEFEKNEILQEFLNITPKQYSLITDETHTMRIGLSAQEAPEEVRSDFGDELGIDLYAMNTYLWKVLQEAIKEINMLKQGWHSHMN